MDHASVLIGFAQLSLVLIGFVAVFVAFFSDKETSTKPDVHHALSMLIGSVISLIVALVPIVLLGYGLDGENLWFWASVVGLAMGAAYGATMLSISLRLTAEEFAEAGVLHMLSSYVLGITGATLMLWNLLGSAGPGPYLLGMILMFAVALLGFVTFAFQNFLKL